MPKMSPELEAIMDRRRRRADGGAASPSPNDPTTGERAEGGDDARLGRGGGGGGGTGGAGGGGGGSSRRQQRGHPNRREQRQHHNPRSSPPGNATSSGSAGGGGGFFPRSTPPVAVAVAANPPPPPPPPQGLAPTVARVTGTPSPRSSPPPPAYRFRPISTSPQPSPGVVGVGVVVASSPSTAATASSSSALSPPSAAVPGAFFRKKIASTAMAPAPGGLGQVEEPERGRHHGQQRPSSSPLRASDVAIPQRRRPFLGRSSVHRGAGGGEGGAEEATTTPAPPDSTGTGRREEHGGFEGREGRRRCGGAGSAIASSSEYDDDVAGERIHPYQEDDVDGGNDGRGEWVDDHHGGGTTTPNAAAVSDGGRIDPYQGDDCDYDDDDDDDGRGEWVDRHHGGGATTSAAATASPFDTPGGDDSGPHDETNDDDEGGGGGGEVDTDDSSSSDGGGVVSSEEDDGPPRGGDHLGYAPDRTDDGDDGDDGDDDDDTDEGEAEAEAEVNAALGRGRARRHGGTDVSFSDLASSAASSTSTSGGGDPMAGAFGPSPSSVSSGRQHHFAGAGDLFPPSTPVAAGGAGEDVVANDDNDDGGSTFFPSNFSEFTTATAAGGAAGGSPAPFFEAFGGDERFPAFDGSGGGGGGDDGSEGGGPSGEAGGAANVSVSGGENYPPHSSPATDAFGGVGADFAPFPAFGGGERGRGQPRPSEDDGHPPDEESSVDDHSSHSSASPPGGGRRTDEDDVARPASGGGWRPPPTERGDDPAALAPPPPPPPQSPAPRSTGGGRGAPGAPSSSAGGGGHYDIGGGRKGVILRSRRLPVACGGAAAGPPPLACTNPITGNVILCHPTAATAAGAGGRRHCHWAVEEIRPVDGGGGLVAASVPVLTPDLQRRLLQRGRGRRGGQGQGGGVVGEEAASTGPGGGGVGAFGACLSVADVVGFAAGVHRQGGGARVKVAAVVDLNPFPVGGGERGPRRVVLVWQWGHDVGRPVALQSVISPPPGGGGGGGGGYDPSSLCVADGLLFLGGYSVADGGNLPCVHIAKPHVRDGWSTSVVGGGGRGGVDGGGSGKMKKGGEAAVTVTALAVTSQPSRSNKYLAVGTSDGSLSVWTYELAASTNRLNRQQGGAASGGTDLLKPLCRLGGARAVADAEESIFVDDGKIAALTTEDDPPSLSASSDKQVDSYCTHLAWNPPGLSSCCSLVMLAAAFTNGLAVYHVALPIVASVTPTGADSMSELSGGGASTTSDENNPSTSTPTTAASTSLKAKKDKKKTKRGFSITGGKGSKNSSSRDQPQQPSPAATADANQRRPSPLEQAVSVSPIVVARASNSGLMHRDGHGRQSRGPKWTRVAWLDLGPRCPPCLALLFGGNGSVSKKRDDDASGSGKRDLPPPSSRIVVGAMGLPLYGYPIVDDGAAKNRQPLAFTTLCEDVVAMPPLELDDPSRFALVGVPVSGAIACPSDEGLAVLSPGISPTTSEEDACSIDDAYFSSLLRPISSRPLGVDSRGASLLADNNDGVLHVFSQLVCRRRDVPSPTESSAASERYDFDFPVQRHWLCCTTVNDRTRQQQNNTRNNVGDDVAATAGARTAVVCELTCGESSSKGLTPHRIVRSHHSGTGFAAVLFSSTLGASAKTITTEPIAYAIFNLSKAATKKTFKLRHGRDLTFVPFDAKSNREVGRLVAISADGKTVYEMVATIEKDVPPGGDDSVVWNKHGLVKMKLGENFDARRVFSPFAESRRLVLAATCQASGRSCLFLGADATASSNNGGRQKMDRWSEMARLLPRKQSPKLWLRVGEEVVSIAHLPDTGRHASSACLAVATQARVMMVSSTSLTVITELETSLMCDTLSPVGSRCVSFCSSVPSGGRSLAKIRYLSCLRDTGSHSSSSSSGGGVIATLPTPRFGHAPSLFLALCPDRLVYLSSHSASMLSERNEAEDAVLLPMAVTRPAMLLEPLVANALCLGGDGVGGGCGSDNVQFTLRDVIDRFGRKSSSFPHGEGEGISLQGSGLTGNIYKMLAEHGCSEANSLILTGNSPYDASTRDNVLPKWIPLTSKAEATNKGTSLRQVLVAGDPHLAGYVNDPKGSMSATLYRANDPSSLLSYEYAVDALLRGNISDAIPLFDFSGSELAERTLVDLLLSLHLKPNAATKDLLKTLCRDSCGGGAASDFCAPGSAMAALVLDLKSRQVKGKVPVDAGECEKISDTLSNEWMRQLAPSVQRQRSTKRVRAGLFDKPGIESAVGERDEQKEPNPIWKDPSNDSKHVWSNGPQGDRESILMLDRIEEWLGRCRPVVLGSEGAAAAEESGTKTLADILSAAAIETQDDALSTGGGCILRDGWVEGVGEGRQDEDNLSAYFRFSEGADEDNGWITDGLKDLTKYNNCANIVGSEMINLEATTSSVDEGEAGKVSLLYDVVFNDRCERGQIGGMLVEAPRGSSLDVGILHGPQHDSRQRCTIEFWFCLPIAEQVQDEIVLTRRSIGSGKDNVNLCCPSANETALWELVLLPEGFLQFRSSGGTVLTTTPNDEPTSDEVVPSVTADSDDDSTIETGLVSWGRDSGGGGWNHVCLVLSSRSQRAATDCSVQIIMRGEIAASSIVSIEIPSIDGGQATDDSHIDKAMQNTALMFGLGAVKGFRMTEVRVWSCARKLDDVKMMMHEYLAVAESKKKFKVKIRNRVKTKPGGVGGLVAPKKGGAVLLSDPPGGSKSSRLPPPASKSRRRRENSDGGSPKVAGPSSSALESGGKVDFAASFEELDKSAESGECKDIDVIKGKERDMFAFKSDFFSASSNSFEDISSSWGFPDSSKAANPDHSADSETPVGPLTQEMNFFENKGNTQDAFASGVAPGLADSVTNPLARVSAALEQTEVSDTEQERTMESSTQSPEQEVGEGDSDASSIQSLYLDASVPLSQEVRSSVAAALIRGPPAARHFGGNRGGLLCSSTTGYDRAQRSNSVAICGAEKTVIYTFGHSPPGKTYPIGASGAIASDALDENGSQFLCCFHAQEKKLLVLDLKNKIMVVELKMTTKLNFWRCLPNEVHGGTVVFLLITPIGAFHWLPLDKDPSPRLIWKRSDELQGKKIIAYEEGGNNGSPDSLSRSTVALLMVPSSAEPESVEAWCLPLNRDTGPFHYGPNVVCASFCRPPKLGQDGASFFPLLCLVLWERNADDDSPHVAKMKMMIETISQYSYEMSVSRGVVLASTTLELDENMLTADLPQPTLAMGTLPVVLLLCFEDIIVVILRKQGIILAYNYDNGSLTLIGRKSVGQFVVDASIRPGEVEGEVEVVLLLCNPLNTKDGRTAVLQLSRIGYML